VRTSPNSSPTNKKRGNVSLSNRIVKPINRSALKKSPFRYKMFGSVRQEYQKDKDNSYLPTEGSKEDSQDVNWNEQLITLGSNEGPSFLQQDFSPLVSDVVTDLENPESSDDNSCSTNKVDSAIKLTLSPSDSQFSDVSLNEQGSVTPPHLAGDVMELNERDGINVNSGANWSPKTLEKQQKKNFHQYWLAKTSALRKFQWNNPNENSTKNSSRGSPRGKQKKNSPRPWENPHDNAVPSVVASTKPVKRVSSFGTEQRVSKLRKRVLGAPQPWEDPHENAIPSVVASLNPVKRVSSFGTKQRVNKLRRRAYGAPQPWENPHENAIPSVVASVNPVKRVSSFGTHQRVSKLLKRKPGAPQPWENPHENAVPSVVASINPGSTLGKPRLPSLIKRLPGAPQPWENPHENAVPSVVASTNNVNWVSSFGKKPRASKSLRKRLPGAPQPWENPHENAVPSVVASINPVHRVSSFGEKQNVGKLRPTFGSARPWTNPHENTIPSVASLGSVQSVSKIKEGRDTFRSLRRPYQGVLSPHYFGSKSLSVSSFGRSSPRASSPREGHFRRFSADCKLDTQAADFAELCLLRSRLRGSSMEKAGLLGQIGSLREELKAANDRIFELDAILQNGGGKNSETDVDAGTKLRGMDAKLSAREVEADRLRKEVETLKVELLNALSLNRDSFRDRGGKDVAYLQLQNQLNAANVEKEWLRNQMIQTKRELHKANKKSSELSLKLTKTKQDINARMKSKLRGLEVRNTSLEKRLKAEMDARKLLQEQLPNDKEGYIKTIRDLERKWNEVETRNREVAAKMGEQETKLKKMESVMSFREKEHALREEELQLKREKVAMLEDVLGSMRDVIVPRELNIFRTTSRKDPNKNRNQLRKFHSRSFSNSP